MIREDFRVNGIYTHNDNLSTMIDRIKKDAINIIPQGELFDLIESGGKLDNHQILFLMHLLDANQDILFLKWGVDEMIVPKKWKMTKTKVWIQLFEDIDGDIELNSEAELDEYVENQIDEHFKDANVYTSIDFRNGVADIELV